MDSNLQIISGKFRGRKLALPATARPTQNRARIALFNILNSTLKTKAATTCGDGSKLTVWDAFAGSGAFGIEFLSRGWAARAIFTDNAPASIKAINKNLNGFDAGEFTVKQTDALAAATEFGPHADIVFVDPPYENPELGEKLIAAITKPGAIIVWETEKSYQLAMSNEQFDVLKDKIYGRARLLILQKKLIIANWSKHDTTKTI